jgi:hypothetical protein
MSKELVIVDLNHKPFAKTDIENITTHQITVASVILIAFPAVATTVTGAVILLKRKYRRV